MSQTPVLPTVSESSNQSTPNTLQERRNPPLIYGLVGEHLRKESNWRWKIPYIAKPKGEARNDAEPSAPHGLDEESDDISKAIKTAKKVAASDPAQVVTLLLELIERIKQDSFMPQLQKDAKLMSVWAEGQKMGKKMRKHPNTEKIGDELIKKMMSSENESLFAG